MSNNVKKETKLKRDIVYLNKDFNSFRRDLENYARIHFSDKLKDFSESGLAGMFIDMNAYVGDVMSYYLDHQFNELNLETAIEPENVERLVRTTGVDGTGASPSFVYVTFLMVVPAKIVNGAYIPDHLYLPVVSAGTVAVSNLGIDFELVADINFAEKDSSGILIANQIINSQDSAGNPLDFIVTRRGLCTSAQSVKETFNIPNAHVPFRTITLSVPDVTEILSVIDSDNNEYYEVDSLADEVVFKAFQNQNQSNTNFQPHSLKLIPAPRRFETNTSMVDYRTTLRFGNGSVNAFKDDVITNPSDFALPLFGERKTFKKIPVNPGKFLDTLTLGFAPINTQLTIRYRAGGGLSHNVSQNNITTLRDLVTRFPDGGDITLIRQTRASIEVFNEFEASGGTDRPTLEDFRVTALNSNGSQNRIVTKQDLIARVYTMPAKFGRVFRAGLAKNRSDFNAVSISLVSRDINGFLTTTSDIIKKNLATYLNEFRLITDTYDIIDAPIANFAIKLTIVVDQRFNEFSIRNQVTNTLIQYFRIENFQIDQPLNQSEIYSLIFNVDGVQQIIDMSIDERSGDFEQRSYSNLIYSLVERTNKGLIFPPRGGIFELKFPNSDILVRVI